MNAECTRKSHIAEAFLALFLLTPVVGFAAAAPIQPDTATAERADWAGDYKLFRYKGHEFIVGVRGAAAQEFPLIGTRKLDKPAYAEQVFPMTIQAQDTYLLYDKTAKKFIVYNIATCLKGKDAGNSEKSDWVGELNPAGERWDGDILVFRKYEKKGPPMRVPYYSMGREYPFLLQDDGACIAQYNYFGNLRLELVSREVADDLLRRIVDDHEQHYHER